VAGVSILDEKITVLERKSKFWLKSNSIYLDDLLEMSSMELQIDEFFHLIDFATALEGSVTFHHFRGCFVEKH
jgi:hypothetical protein